MKRITLISLFFCLAITTVLAQATIDIATPNSNGLSNNQVDDFDVATDGTILNNSASDGIAQLGSTAVTANSNITAGSEANLILLQVTGTSGSDLDGTIEVFGSEAGLIIANPNGIDCDGCGFVNISRVDLVTGTSNFSGDDLTGFSIDDAAIFFVRNTGFVSDAVADELNLVSRDLRIQAQAKANTTLRVLAGNDTYDHTTNIITSGTTEVSAHSIQINASGYLEANYIELISTEISSSHGILNAGGDIEAGRLKLDSNGLFRNQEGGGNLGDINISGLLEVITADRFINNGNITADTLTITTDEFFNNHNGTTQLGKIFVIDTFSLSTPNASYTNTGTVTSDSLNLTVGGDFTHESTTLEDFTFNNLAITATNSDFINNTALVVSDTLKITANSFVNTSGSISTDSFALSVAGDFDYIADFLNNNINTNRLNLNVGGNFSNNDSASDFTWGEQNNLTVLGTADITTNNYIQYGAIDVVGVWTIIANADFTHSNTNNDFVWGTNDSLSVTGNADITTNNFANSGTISAETLAISVAGDFDYSSDFLNAGTITANNQNFTARNGVFTNDTTISLAAGNLGIIANTFINTGVVVNVDTFNLSINNDFDYIADYLNNGIITTNTLNLQVGGNFSNNDASNDFTWRTNDSLTVLGTADITATDFTNAGTISVNAILNITATSTADNSFENTGVVAADTFALSVAGDFGYGSDFINIDATSIDLSIGGDFNYINSGINFVWNAGDKLVVSGRAFFDLNDFINEGNITADSLVIEVDNNFRNRKSSATINANSFVVDAEVDFFNQNFATINATSFNVTAVGNSVLFTDKGFVNIESATISADDFNVTVTGPYGEFRNESATINANNFDAAVNSVFWLREGGVINADNIDLAVNIFSASLSSTINATNVDIRSNGNVRFNTSVTINADNLSINATQLNLYNSTIINVNNFDAVLTQFFDNDSQSIINANNFNVTVTGSFRNFDGSLINVTDNFSVTTDYYLKNNASTILANNFNAIVRGQSTEAGFFNENSATILANNFNATLTSSSFNNVDSNIITSNFNVASNMNFSNRNTVISTNTIIDADNVNITAGGNFENRNTAVNGNVTINAINNVSITAGGNFENRNTAAAFGSATIAASSLDFTADTINNEENIYATTILNITATSTADNSFKNTGGVATADIFNLSVAGNFDYATDYLNNGTITIDTLLNLNVGGNFIYNESDGDFTWDASDSLVVSGNADITANNYTQYGAIDVAGVWTINANNYTYNRLINDFIWDAQNSLVVSGNADITTNNFTNDGNISAETLAISVAGDFDYSSDFLNNGTITADNLNFTLRNGAFTNDTTIDLAVGSLGITANNFINFSASSVTANNFTLILTNNFANGGNINVTGSGSSGSLAITAGYTAINQGSIVSDSLDITANDFFRNLTGGDISVDNFVITAGGKVTNTASITVGTLSIIANDDSSRDNDTTGFYVSNRGNITATTLNIAAVDNFYNRGNITATTFNITRAKSVFFLNEEIDSFVGTYDGGNISLSGDSSFIAAGGVIENYGNIDLGSNNLDITADIYTNQASSNVTADTLNLDVSSFVQHGTISATVEFK